MKFPIPRLSFAIWAVIFSVIAAIWVVPFVRGKLSGDTPPTG